MAPPSKDKQNALLKQFRQQLQEQDLIHEGDTIGTDDATLLRFLRARQFDVKAATTMWANCQNWRKTVEGVGIDELYRQLDPYDYPERPQVFECWPLWFHKTDKQGRPLNIHHFGGINMPELYKHITPEKFWQTIVVNAESLTREVLPASARAAGRQIDGTFVIVDLKGFGLGQFWQMKNLARDSFQISQDYFPETMAQLAIINAPSSFTTIWSFIKPWLAKETLAKIDILGSDYKDVLLTQIDPENLPESLGGTCTCAELGGCKLSNAGPWMDGRKERREQWLKGERKRMGLGMEGEDEADEHRQGVKPEHEQEKSPSSPEAAETNVEAAGNPTEKESAVELSQASTHSSTDVGSVYGKSTAVVDSHGGVEKTSTPPHTETESSPESTSGPSTPTTDVDSETGSIFEDAQEDLSEDTEASANSASTGSAVGGKTRSLKKFKLPKVSLSKLKSKSKSMSREREQSVDEGEKNDKKPQIPETREEPTGGLGESKSREKSIDAVYKDHPDTRQPQTGDFVPQH